MSLLGGAECSTAGNPLTQFTKHIQDDKSLQRDRLVGRSPGGIQGGLRSSGLVGGQDNVSISYNHLVSSLATTLGVRSVWLVAANIRLSGHGRVSATKWSTPTYASAAIRNGGDAPKA